MHKISGWLTCTRKRQMDACFLFFVCTQISTTTYTEFNTLGLWSHLPVREPSANRSCSRFIASCVLIPKWEAKSSKRTTLELCKSDEGLFNTLCYDASAQSGVCTVCLLSPRCTGWILAAGCVTESRDDIHHEYVKCMWQRNWNVIMMRAHQKSDLVFSELLLLSLVFYDKGRFEF